MRTPEELKSELRRLDGKGYKAYRDIKGAYEFDSFRLIIDHVQSDPFAPPSRMRIRIGWDRAGFPEEVRSSSSREIAFRDFLARSFHSACRRKGRGKRGTGKGGRIEIDRPGQEILDRTAVLCGPQTIEVRFTVGLPAFGRRIAGRIAAVILLEEVPRIAESSLFASSLDSEKLFHHIKTAEDADAVREALPELGLIAFTADGAVLPRVSGVDDRPLQKGTVIPFKSPDSLRVSIPVPNSGKIQGMGIRKGVTLIVGGGYHGKSTLLHALERGVYNHIPGDGREFVVADPDAVKIRSEDGRRVEKVDISPFIGELPFSGSTREFSSEDASGSTSQAANIMEALEAGAKTLLIDEDTSATNFMIRDHRMQELVPKSQEPITPFIDKVRHLSRDRGVSTVLVIGGSGDYFDAADRVICMKEYLPYDLTSEAKAIAQKYRAERRPEGGDEFGAFTPRIPLGRSLDPSRGRKPVKVGAKGLRSVSFGREYIDLSAVEQLVDASQTRAVAQALVAAKAAMDGRRTLREVLDEVEKSIREKGLDVLTPYPVGGLAAFRSLELAAAVNRLRTLQVQSIP